MQKPKPTRTKCHDEQWHRDEADMFPHVGSPESCCDKAVKSRGGGERVQKYQKDVSILGVYDRYATQSKPSYLRATVHGPLMEFEHSSMHCHSSLYALHQITSFALMPLRILQPVRQLQRPLRKFIIFHVTPSKWTGRISQDR